MEHRHCTVAGHSPNPDESSAHATFELEMTKCLVCEDCREFIQDDNLASHAVGEG